MGLFLCIKECMIVLFGNLPRPGICSSYQRHTNETPDLSSFMLQEYVLPFLGS